MGLGAPEEQTPKGRTTAVWRHKPQPLPRKGSRHSQTHHLGLLGTYQENTQVKKKMVRDRKVTKKKFFFGLEVKKEWGGGGRD